MEFNLPRLISRALRRFPFNHFRGSRLSTSKQLMAALIGALVLSGCTEARLLTHVAKTTSGKPEPIYKVGQPYKIGNVWYHPREQPEYDKTGIASWYGKKFHGLTTANGENYDMNTMTAAHPTLPMPSLVRVTNLENGRSTILRVNDRGPFKNNRIIDVSRQAANMLGFRERGLAKVRVQYLGRAALHARGPVPAPGQSLQIASAGATYPVPQPLPADRPAQAAGFSQTAQIGTGPLPSVSAKPSPAVSARMFVQAGAFGSEANAHRLGNELRHLGGITIAPVQSKKAGRLFRVRVGPLATIADADSALASVLNLGHTGAKIVVD